MPSIKLARKTAFSLFVLATIFYLIDANDVLAVLASADSWMVVAAIGWALSSQIFSAMRLNRLAQLQNISLTFVRVLFIGLSAVFYGLLLPAGNVATLAVRFIQLSREARVESVAAALVTDRVIATIFLIAIGIVAILFDWAEPVWSIAIVLGIFLTVGLVVFGRHLVWRMWDWLENTSNLGLPHKLDEWAGRIGAAFKMYSRADVLQVVIIVASTLLAHMCGCLVYFTLAKSLDLDLTLLSICWIRSGVTLITMIPVSVAGLGLREVAAIALLVPLGIAEAQAVGFSILVFLVASVIVGLIGGCAELYRAVNLT